jgi:ubiquinone/menaquinone biosynthesis C-methylase UbiE
VDDGLLPGRRLIGNRKEQIARSGSDCAGFQFMSQATERFSDRVENYVKYRPGYPPEVLQLFQDEMGLQESSVVADIGAGTGISARLFLANGNEVYGVEPNEAMREAANEYLRDFPNFRAVDGTAENTTLDPQSVDLIIAAQAFHWFDREPTRDEFRRILRPNGFVALIWNERRLAENEFLREYEKLLLEFGTDYKEVRHEKVTNEIIGRFFPAEFRTAVFSNSQIFGFEGLKGRLLSSSYAPNADHPRFSQMIKELKRLFTKHQKNDTIEILYDTKVFYGHI